MLQILSPDFKRLKRIIFEPSSTNMNKGEEILRFLNINPEAKMRSQNILSNQQIAFIRDMFRGGTTLNMCLHDPLGFLMSSEHVLVSETINRFLPCFSKNSFTLKKKYTVVDAVDPEVSWGKFSGALSNFMLIDKNNLVADLIEMVQGKLNEVYVEHAHREEYVKTTDQLIALIKQRARYFKINEYAIQVCGKMTDRNGVFVNGWDHGFREWGMQNKINTVMYPFRSLAQYSFSSPFCQMLEKVVYMNFTMDTLMFVINFIIVLVDAIMIYTLFISDIEERTYEFAMLRTLGFQKHSLVILLTVQALFFSLPATVIGFVLLYNFTTAA